MKSPPTYTLIEKTQPEAFADFIRYLEYEKEKARRMAAVLSPGRRADYLASFDDEEKRLELFARWLSSAGPGGQVELATTLPTSS